MTNLRRKFQGKLNGKQNVPYTVSGLLGNSIGIVKVPNRENYVYVRLAGSGVAEVFNNRVESIYDLPVICGYDPLSPQKFQVLNVNGIMSESVGYVAKTGYAPASRYRWMFPDGGQDVLFSELRQLMPLRITPVAGMNVVIHNQPIWTGTEWIIFGGSTNIDLTSYIPTNSGKCLMLLVSIDTDGNVVLTAGNEVNITDLAITDIPVVPNGTRYILGAVRLYYGQTVIQEARNNTDIVDLRWPMAHNHPASELTDISWSDISMTGSDLADLATRSHTDLTDIGTLTHSELETSLSGKAASVHTHVEADITDLATDDHDHSGDAGDGGTFDAANLTSGSSTDGQVLTSDGSGGAAWEDVNGGGSPLTVQEIDGTPNVSNVTQINITNGTLTDDGNGEITINFGSAATDGAAIHDNVADEISAISEKTTLADNDLFLIEDSEASGVKKKVKKSNLGGDGAGLVLIAEWAHSSDVSSVDIAIPSGALSLYSAFKIIISARTDRSGELEGLRLRFSTGSSYDTGNNYFRRATETGSSTATENSTAGDSIWIGRYTFSGVGATNGAFGTAEFIITGWNSSSKMTNVIGKSMMFSSASGYRISDFWGTWTNLGQVDGMRFYTDTGANIVTGSWIKIYGVKS